MEEFLIILVRFLCEFLFELLLNVIFDWPSKDRKTPEPESIVLTCFFALIFSCILGWISILFFKNTFIQSPILRVINLFLAPYTSALLSEYIAKKRAVSNHFIRPRHHFWQALFFTLGFIMIRFAYTAH